MQTRIWRFLVLNLYVVWDAGHLTVTRPFFSHVPLIPEGCLVAYRQVLKIPQGTFTSLLRLQKLIRILRPNIMILINVRRVCQQLNESRLDILRRVDLSFPANSLVKLFLVTQTELAMRKCWLLAVRDLVELSTSYIQRSFQGLQLSKDILEFIITSR